MHQWTLNLHQYTQLWPPKRQFWKIYASHVAAKREASKIPRDEKISEVFSGAISDQNAKDEETIDPAPPHTYLGIFGQFDPYIVKTCTLLRHSSLCRHLRASLTQHPFPGQLIN